ncbi:MAG: rhodanese-like domain-containing protein [Phycisphaeraceae bacterium]|nr:rhodanese-like domain-containing protein [Phycisphaeraceae bacterium]
MIRTFQATPENSPELDEHGMPIGRRCNEDWEISPRQTKRLLDAGEIVLIDCRRDEEHDAVRIDGAELFPLDDLGSMLDELEAHRGRRIVIHCHSGVRSLKAAAFLRAQGFEDARSMAGGIDLWSVAVDPGVLRYTK